MRYQPRDKREFRRVFNNIYAKNLPDGWDEAKTREEFGKFGPIGMIKFERNEIGAYAMIAYFSENKEDRETGPKAAAAAVEEMNGKELAEGKKCYVKQFLNKESRLFELKKETMKYKNSKKRCNLYVKNIPENSTEESIREFFAPFGEIESIRLFPKDKEEDKKGEGKKNFFCFVCFRKPDAASTAKEKLHNTPIPGQTRPLCINHYEIKEIRELLNEESQDKLGFRQFREKHAEKQWSETVNQEDLLACLSRILQQLPPHLWNQQRGGRPNSIPGVNGYGAQGGMPGQQRQGNFHQKQGFNQAPRDGQRSQGRPQNMPMGQQNKPMGQMAGQPMGQMAGQPMSAQPGFPQAQPTSIQEAFLQKTMPILKGVTAENPYYKQ